MSRYTLDQKIACVSRELGMRLRVYPRQVEEGRMPQHKAIEEIGIMEEILSDLKAQLDKTQPGLFDQ